MNKRMMIDQDYLYIPIKPGKEERYFDFYFIDGEEKELFTEVKIPYKECESDDYDFEFYAEIPVKKEKGKELLVEGDASPAFFEKIILDSKRVPEKSKKPVIHFAADTGWTNDPNGLVYKNGIYHMYFQYNPFNTAWNNMTWGHAVSKDLLHWEILDSVMFPDEEGTMFSGCGLVNEREELGLPKDALLFSYTVAGGTDRRSEGKPFIQKFAYSLDGGETLNKMAAPFVDKIYYDSRDPKIFWHEETNGYCMVLWLREQNFGVLRSDNLENWTLVQEITLEDGWECPDLFLLKDKEGNNKWFYWCAAGYYYAGDFDGYTFTQTQEKHSAYLNPLPYAAQTYSGIEGKTVSIPWYRSPDDGRPFVSTYGIPVELGFKYVNGKALLTQKPVDQFFEALVECNDLFESDEEAYKVNVLADSADVFKITLKDPTSRFVFHAGSDEYCYHAGQGMLRHDRQKLQAGYGYKELLVIIDDKIVEIFLDGGIKVGAFWNDSEVAQIILYKKDIENIIHYHVL